MALRNDPISQNCQNSSLLSYLYLSFFLSFSCRESQRKHFSRFFLFEISSKISIFSWYSGTFFKFLVQFSKFFSKKSRVLRCRFGWRGQFLAKKAIFNFQSIISSLNANTDAKTDRKFWIGTKKSIFEAIGATKKPHIWKKFFFIFWTKKATMHCSSKNKKTFTNFRKIIKIQTRQYVHQMKAENKTKLIMLNLC